VAFSPIKGIWFLIGASPDLRAQILTAPEFAPYAENGGISPIAGVFLPSAATASVMGLLHLRESQSYFVFATSGVQRLLKNENKIFRVVNGNSPTAQWQMLSTRGRIGCHLSDNPGDPPTFYYSSVSLGGGYPEFASDEFRRNAAADEANVSVVIEQDGKKLFVAPSIAGGTSLWTKAASADLALVDGAYWSDDELVRAGIGEKTARELGHVPISGAGGLLEQYPQEANGRQVLIGVSHTNPVLNEASEEHRAVLDAGFAIAYDGMELEL
jgi:pyrroloquinoline quinone biosynthesis protein B